MGPGPCMTHNYLSCIFRTKQSICPKTVSNIVIEASPKVITGYLEFPLLCIMHNMKKIGIGKGSYFLAPKD